MFKFYVNSSMILLLLALILRSMVNIPLLYLISIIFIAISNILIILGFLSYKKSRVEKNDFETLNKLYILLGVCLFSDILIFFPDYPLKLDDVLSILKK